MADDVVAPRPIDSGLQQADIAATNEQAAKEKADKKAAKKATLTLQKPPEAVAEPVETTDDGESAGDEGEQQPTTNPGKANTPRGVQKKLDKLTREKYEAAAQAEYWRKQAESRQEAPQQATEPARPAVDGKPTLAQFNFDQEAYLEALSDWKVEAKLAEAEKRRAQSEAEKAESEKVAGYQQRASKFATEHPDFEDVALKAPINYSPAMLDFIKESEMGPQIGYYLGQHLDEAKAIEAMPAMRQAIALDRLERQLSEPEPDDEPVPPRRVITQAPPPPATITPGGSAKRSVTDPTLSSAERIAMWRRRKSG